MTDTNKLKTFLLVAAVLAMLIPQRAKTLNDFAFPMFIQSAGTHNPADSTTYFFSSLASAPITTGGVYRRYFLRYGRVVRISLHVLVLGTLGSAEDGEAYIRINGTDTYRIDNGFAGQGAIEWDALFDYRFVEFGEDYGTPAPYVTTTDYFEIEIHTPAWPVTNPTLVAYYGDVWVEP